MGGKKITKKYLKQKDKEIDEYSLVKEIINNNM